MSIKSEFMCGLYHYNIDIGIVICYNGISKISILGGALW